MNHEWSFIMSGDVILIASGKGGTGKTVFASNLGAQLALMGKSVVMIDMDMGLRNLDLYMGLESRVIYDAGDVMLGICRIKQALIRDKRFEDLYLIAAPQFKKEQEITPLHMKVLCRRLREKFDYVIVDAPGGIGENFEIAAAGCDKAVIVTLPEMSAIRDADVVDSLLDEIGIKSRKYVLNMVRPDSVNSGFLPNLSEIARMFRIEPAGLIQYDENINIAAARGIPIVMKQGTYISENFTKIVNRIIED